MNATVERRASRRLPATDNRTALEWWDGSARRAEARLVNVSQGGALLSAAGSPGIGQRVWLRMEAPAVTPWVDGRVVRVDDAGSVGICFSDPCPRDVFEAAVQGIGFGNVLGTDAAMRAWTAPGISRGPLHRPAEIDRSGQESDSGTTNGAR